VVASAPAPDPAPRPDVATTTRRYVVLTQGRPSGSLVAETGPGGTVTIAYEYNDRGRGPKLDVRLDLDEQGIPSSLVST